MFIRTCLLATVALATLQVHAQATRTWVSGVGDDVNPCSRTAPCKTFAGAISKTAAGGEINALDPAGYGAVTITKAITIDGGGNLSSVLVAGTNGIVINAGATDRVILRNLEINGSGTGLSGIRFLAGSKLLVESTRIYNFADNGVYMGPTSGTATLVMNRVTVSQNRDSATADAAGVRLIPGASAKVDATFIDVVVDSNDRGIHVLDGSVATVKNSAVTNNLYAGIAAKSSGRPTSVVVENSISTGNLYGVRADSSNSQIHIANTLLTRNGYGFGAEGGGVVTSFGNNRIFGNTQDYIGSPLQPGTQN
jgi:hypothetical protein